MVVHTEKVLYSNALLTFAWLSLVPDTRDTAARGLIGLSDLYALWRPFGVVGLR